MPSTAITSVPRLTYCSHEAHEGLKSTIDGDPRCFWCPCCMHHLCDGCTASLDYVCPMCNEPLPPDNKSIQIFQNKLNNNVVYMCARCTTELQEHLKKPDQARAGEDGSEASRQ